MSGFKLNFESQFDILYAIFCFSFSLYWCCSWHTKKTKGNDQDLTKYLINDCSSFWIMRVSLWVQTMLSLAQSVPYHPPPKKYPAPPPHTHTKGPTEGSLCIFRDGSPPPPHPPPPHPHTHTKGPTEGSLCIFRDGSVSTFS